MVPEQYRFYCNSLYNITFFFTDVFYFPVKNYLLKTSAALTNYLLSKNFERHLYSVYFNFQKTSLSHYIYFKSRTLAKDY